MKQTLVKIVAALQIVVGVLLLVGTVGLTTTAYRTVRDESEQLAANLSASAEALESLRATYEQSATSLFGLTEAMDDVSAKLVVVSGAISETGRRLTRREAKGTFLTCFGAGFLVPMRRVLELIRLCIQRS